MSRSVRSQSYKSRIAAYDKNPTAKLLLEIMDRKQSNLCLSIDVTKKEQLLNIVDAVGPYLCVVKTHIDIVEDFDQDLIERLQRLSQQHDFLIFEDRKFADIGNTVMHQYSSGIYHISSWAHITNAHPIPGPGIIDGLAAVGLPLGRALLLLAEMSSKGTLARGEYSRATVEMARAKREFVVGFIGMGRVEDNFPSVTSTESEDFLILTPGVGLDVKGDSMGQQYRTPRQVVYESGCDIIIVGRGIYGKGDDIAEMKRQAERYKTAGWNAYLERIGEPVPQ